jgi:hypothetical protein
MKPYLFLVVILAVSACAFAQIEHPQIGVMLDENGDARVVLGVAGSTTLGDPILSGVISLACSAQRCFAKTRTALLSSSGESIDAPAGPAVFAIDGAAAYVYFPETRQLARWHDGQLEPVVFTPNDIMPNDITPTDFPGNAEVLALRATVGGFEYAVRRADGVWAGDRNLGDVTAVQLLGDGSVLTANGEQVRLLRSDGTEADFAVAGVQSFIRISDACVQLVTSSGMWALAIEPGQERVFLLPGGSQSRDSQSQGSQK